MKHSFKILSFLFVALITCRAFGQKNCGIEFHRNYADICLDLRKGVNSIQLDGQAIFRIDSKNLQAFEVSQMILNDKNMWTEIIDSDDRNVSATFKYGHFKHWHLRDEVSSSYHFVIDYDQLAKKYILLKGEQFVLVESGNQLVITFAVKTPTVQHEYPFSADVNYEIGILSANHKNVIILEPYKPVRDQSKES